MTRRMIATGRDVPPPPAFTIDSHCLIVTICDSCRYPIRVDAEECETCDAAYSFDDPEPAPAPLPAPSGSGAWDHGAWDASSTWGEPPTTPEPEPTPTPKDDAKGSE